MRILVGFTEIVGMVAGLIALGILVVIVATILLVGDAMTIRKTRKQERARARTKQRKQTRSSLIGIAFVAGFVALTMNGVVPPGVFGGGLMLLLIAVPLLLVGIVLYGKVKYRKTIEAAALANAGDVEGGILEIRRAIEEQPQSADLWNTLAVLLCVQQDYEEALGALQRAEELGLNKSLIATNRALILWKLGRTDEALALNTVECENNPNNFNAAVNQCHILADLGRHDEAERQLQVVEAQPRVLFPASERKRRKQLVQELHEKLQPDTTTRDA